MPTCLSSPFKPATKPLALLSHLMKRWLGNYGKVLWLLATKKEKPLSH